MSNSQILYQTNGVLPPIQYTGSIIYYTDFNDIACACSSLLQIVESLKPAIVPIAFDMEWAFKYSQGAGKTAVIQLCSDLEVCYVFQVAGLKRLPAALVQLLNHPRVCLHGVNIKNDFRKLERDYDLCARNMIVQCRDLGEWYNRVYNKTGNWSMEKLVANICHLQINKDKRLRLSAWDTCGLSEEQQMYAAIDVYIARYMYHHLSDAERTSS